MTMMSSTNSNTNTSAAANSTSTSTNSGDISSDNNVYKLMMAIANSTDGLSAIADAEYNSLESTNTQIQGQIDQLNDINSQMDDPDADVNQLMGEASVLNGMIMHEQTMSSNTMSLDVDTLQEADAVTQNTGKSIQKDLAQLEKPITKKR